jgi:NADP-dependent 3-hydroxy acid dehydrogenase YdfG
VTGASRGIGRAVARLLVQGGARVALVARNRADLAAYAEELGARAIPCAFDLTDIEQVTTAVPGAIAALGGSLDILVSNAGIFPLGAVAETTPESFAATLHVNLAAPYRVLHAALSLMRAQGAGHVVTIGSVADRRIYPGNGAYSASKFGARALHEVLREELTGSGIRCTLISPAATDTSIWDPVDPDTTPGFPARAAMLRADDVADAVFWAVTRPAHVNVDELRLSRS